MTKILKALSFFFAFLFITACSSDSDDVKDVNLSDLQIYFSADNYSISAGEVISIPFSIAGVEGKTLTLTASCSNEAAITKITNNASYEGNISFTAPSVLTDNSDIIVTLTAEDKANNRTGSNTIAIAVSKSEDFTLEWVGDYKSIALKSNGSFKMDFLIHGATDKSVRLNTPVTTVSNGYTATTTVEDATKGNIVVKSTGALTSSINVILSLTDNFNRSYEISKNLEVIEAESTTGAANCYILAPGSTKTINASVKGNSTETIDFDYAELVWQDEQSLIKSVAGSSDEKVIVVTCNPGIIGNAVVAAYKGQDIVWSWHLWVTDFDPEAKPLVWTNTTSNVTYNMMDRNLGAKSNQAGTNACFGLLYQWGRKDPFVGSKGMEDNVCIPKYNIDNVVLPERKFAYKSEDVATKTNLDYSIKNPDAFIYPIEGITTFSDWLTINSNQQDNDLWGYQSKYKTKYDPCPEGWRVAPSEAWGFRKNYKKEGSLNGAGGYDKSYPWYWDDVTDAGFYYHESDNYYFFPMCGMRNNADGDMKSTGGSANFATPVPSQNYVITEMFAFGNPASETGLRRDYGNSIRCVRDYNY